MEKNEAIVYVRVSTADQAAHGVSLDAQVASCKAYCTLARLDVAAILIEAGVSASIAFKERPEGAKLMAALKAKRAFHVVSYKLDRLFRDAADALNQTRDWDRAGIAMHLVDVGGQTINTSTAMGRMFLTMMAGFAELERNLVSERTTAALRHKKANGLKTGGSLPYGWKLAADGKHLERDEDEQEAVTVARGMRTMGASFFKIAEHLGALGYQTRTGKDFAPIQVQRMIEYKEGASTAA